MSLRIENQSAAENNRIFGVFLPAIIAALAVINLFTGTVGSTPNSRIISVLACIFWVGAMYAVYLRRGKNAGVDWIEFADNVHGEQGGTRFCHESDELARFQYEGVHNKTRVDVVDAPFPAEGERILVVTLRDGTEYRTKVFFEHDQPLKEIATRASG